MILVLSILKRFISILLAMLSLLDINSKSVNVELYSNPTTGYSWEYSFSRPGVMTISGMYYTPDTSAILIGGGGTQHFKFKAVSQGTVKITFEYVKYTGLTKNVASEYIYTYTVNNDGTISQVSIQ